MTKTEIKKLEKAVTLAAFFVRRNIHDVDTAVSVALSEEFGKASAEHRAYVLAKLEPRAFTTRIVALVDHVWPSTKFDANAMEMPFGCVRVQITKANERAMPYMASVDIEPNLNLHGPGYYYVVRANIPAFNGTVEQMADYAEVVAILGSFMTQLNQAEIIKGK